MKYKMLYILNIANKVNSFSYTSMLAAKKLDYEYHIAGNWGYKSETERENDEKKYGIKIHQIDFIRQPYHPGNIKAYKQICNIIAQEKFDVIHCNTPIGGVVGRIAGKKYRVPTVIYQAHGFHFYDGAPLINWLIYYPIEKILGRYTDILITINKEDYERGSQFRLKGEKRVFYVPGVGLEPSSFVFDESIRINKRSELNVDNETILLISAGDLVKRKNYSVSIKAIADLNDERVKLLICGTGPEEQSLRELAKRLNVENQVVFMGFRTDIKELLSASDIFLFTTLQEGLPRSLSEAMAAGLPCVVSRIRGNTDLIEDDVGGYLCRANSDDEFAQAIQKLINSSELRASMKLNNLNTISRFDNNASFEALLNIYKTITNEG